MLVQEDNSVIYKCKDDHFYLNFPSLNYPSNVTAVCTTKQLFKGVLPFWKIEGISFPTKGAPLCITSLECSIKPPLTTSKALINNWNKKDNQTGTKIKIFCHMEGDRGLATFNTTNDDALVQDAFEGDIQIFLFRSEIKKKLVKFRVHLSEKVYIFLSNHSQKLSNNSFCLEIEHGVIKMSLFVESWFKPITEKLIPYPTNNTYDMWLSITTHKSLYIGSWKENGESTVFSLSHLDNLNQLNNIAFSSFAFAEWEVQNGMISN